MPNVVVKDERLAAFKNAWDLSAEFNQPYFDQGLRNVQMWMGKLPSEMDALWMKVNLHPAQTALQYRIPKQLAAVFATPDFLELRASGPFYDLPHRKQAPQMWLLDLMRTRLNMRWALLPTLQQVNIMGTGYRMPRLAVKDGRTQIVSVHRDFFQILPSPNGGHANPIDAGDEGAVDWVFETDWATDTAIKARTDAGMFDSTEVNAMLKDNQGYSGSNAIDETYRQQWTHTVGGVTYDGPEAWFRRIGQHENMPRRRRIVYWHQRDRLMIVADDKYVLYDGEPFILKGVIPVARYASLPCGMNWHGFSTLEMAYDMFVAIQMMTAMQLQLAVKVLHPVKFVRDDILRHAQNKTALNAFADATVSFPDTVQDVQRAVFYDMAQGAPPQVFQLDQYLRMVVEALTGVKEFGQRPGVSEYGSNRSATGITAVLSEANRRFLHEAEQLEHGGLKDEAKLLLMLGAEYETESTEVRAPGALDGFDWREVDPDDIVDEYDVVTRGTAFLTDEAETQARMQAMLPLLLGRPDLVDSQEVLRQAEEVMRAFPRPEDLWINPTMALGGPTAPALASGAGGAMGLENSLGAGLQRGMQRSQSKAGTLVPA